MTTTLAFGDSADGYLHSFDATYAGARNGPADGVNAGTAAYHGQNNNGGTFTTFQTFLRFAYPAASGLVTSAYFRVSQLSQLSTGVARDLEFRAYTWSAGGLTVADWRNPATVAASTLYGVVRNVQASAGKHTYAGSETLRSFVQGGTTAAEFVLTTSRQRAGNTPTSDEGGAIATADADGTLLDPCLIFTTHPTHSLSGLMGMSAQLSDGSWIWADPIGPPAAIRFYRRDPAGGDTQVAEALYGTTSTTWGQAAGAQGWALVVDAADNFYVVGPAGDAPNALRERAFQKNAGSWTWTGKDIRTVSLPTHDAAVNNITAAWHPTAGGTLVIFAAHAAGDGVSGGNSNDLAYALVSTQYLLTGSGTHVRAVDRVDPLGLVPSSVASGDFSGYMNETGTGLEVLADPHQGDWGYLTSFRRAQRLGENGALFVSRYVLLPTGAGFLHASYVDATAFGTKDAAAKVRLLSVGSGQVALVAADTDTGYGLCVEILQASGLSAGLVSLGYVMLAEESIPNMPDGPAVAASSAWDAVYSLAENAVWVYYVPTGSPTLVRRTSVSLNTYQATRVVMPVHTATSNVVAIRVPRNAQVTQRSLVTASRSAGGFAHTVDVFNLAPLAPTLVAKANYDATMAGVFTWTFNDPNTGDGQSARRFVIERVSDGVAVVDTTKAASTAQTYTVTAGTLANGVDYRWRVMTWDLLDVASPWSNYGTFSTSAAGSVNITAPAADNPAGVITDDFLIAWTATGTTQAAYRIWVARNDTAATVYDSGWVTSTATAAMVTGMVSDVEHTVRVQVRNASAVVSGIGTRLITPSYGTPEAPLVVLTPVTEGGYVLVDVDNPIPGESGIGATFWDMEGTPDLASWHKSGGTLGTSTAHVYRGAQAAALVSTGAGVAHVFCRAPAVNVTTGQRYAIRAWMYSETARDVSLAIDWQDAGGVYVTDSTTTVTLAANTWTAVEAAGNCPAGATKAIYGWGILATPAVGVTVWADDLRLAPASDRPDVVRNRVFRRRLGAAGPWDVLGECGPDGDFRDYTAPSGIPLEYLVRGETV
jgi:hypothetical protein